MTIGLISDKLNLFREPNNEINNINIKLIDHDISQKFDILVFNKPSKFIPKNLLISQNNKTFVLINSDEYKSFYAFKNIFLITYGLNNKSSVTISSIGQNKIQLCIQRSFITINKKIIEEQEFSIKIKNGEKYLDEILFLAISNILIFGDTKNLSNWFNN